MDNTLRFHQDVAEDLRSAAAWYDQISTELGIRFRKSVDVQLDRVERFPKSFAKVQGELRACRISGFPYLVLFQTDESETEVLGIFHAVANPERWTERQ